MHLPSLSQTIARESPTFAVINYGPLVSTIQHVVPENWQFNTFCFKSVFT